MYKRQALIGAASAFIESKLAQIYKIRGKEGEFRGGPAYYIPVSYTHLDVYKRQVKMRRSRISIVQVKKLPSVSCAESVTTA